MTASAVDTNVQSRFKVLERPVLSPGKCTVCGAVDREVVDFGANVNFYGAIYMCVTCVSEAGERIGMVRPEKHVADNLQSGQSVEEYLAAHNLKVISDELYDALFAVVHRGFAFAAGSDARLDNNLDDTNSEASSGNSGSSDSPDSEFNL